MFDTVFENKLFNAKGLNDQIYTHREERSVSVTHEKYRYVNYQDNIDLHVLPSILLRRSCIQNWRVDFGYTTTSFDWFSFFFSCEVDLNQLVVGKLQDTNKTVVQKMATGFYREKIHN